MTFPRNEHEICEIHFKLLPKIFEISWIETDQCWECLEKDDCQPKQLATIKRISKYGNRLSQSKQFVLDCSTTFAVAVDVLSQEKSAELAKFNSTVWIPTLSKFFKIFALSGLWSVRTLENPEIPTPNRLQLGKSWKSRLRNRNFKKPFQTYV